MEILKKIFSPRYRELVRLTDERRIRNMVRGKDLSKPIDVHAGGWRYLGVTITGQDGKNLEIKGNGSFAYRPTRHISVESGNVHGGMRAYVMGSGVKKLPFSSVDTIK